MNRFITSLIVIFLTAGGARAELDHVTWDGRVKFDGENICSGMNPPTTVGVTLFSFEGGVYGFMRFGWYENNQPLRADQYIVLDVKSPGAGKIFGSNISIPSLKFNEGVTGIINGAAGTTLDVAVEGQGWKCREPLLKWNNAAGFGSREAKQRFDFISEARKQGTLGDPCSDERISLGPTELEVNEQLGAAIASQLCSPQDLEGNIGLQMYRASGVGDYRAIGRSCRAFLFETPLMDITASRRTSTCKVGVDNTADCMAVFDLSCATPDVSANGTYCLGLNLASVNAEASFKYNPESCEWEAQSVSLRK